MSARENEVLIGVGANVPGPAGTPIQTIAAAIERLRAYVDIQRVSAPFQNPAFPAGAGPDFLNLVVAGVTALAAKDVLTELLALEVEFGRTRSGAWGPRSIDLDLLSVGSEISAGYWVAAAFGDRPGGPIGLMLPHPRLQHRRSVLVPLAEIYPAWRHPALGLSAKTMLDRLA